MEFELFLLLLCVEAIRQAVRHRWLLVQAAGVALLLAAITLGAGQVKRYVLTAYEPLYPIPPSQTAERRTIEALRALQPVGRAAVSGVCASPPPRRSKSSRASTTAARLTFSTGRAPPPAASPATRAATPPGCFPRLAPST